MDELLTALELAVKESREMLVKCHAKFVELDKVQELLDRYRGGKRKATHLKPDDIRPLLDRHYPTEFCKAEGALLDKNESKEDDEVEAKKDAKKEKKAYFKSCGKKDSADQYSIITVTLAIGRQLLLEHQSGKA